MIIGMLLVGMFAGAGAGVAALIAGHSVWAALALYAGVGVACTLAGALVASLLGPCEESRAMPGYVDLPVPDPRGN